MKKAKFLKSICEKAWLFDVEVREDDIKAGIACYLPDCDIDVVFEIDGKRCKASVSSQAVASHVPIRILNARLPLLVNVGNE